MGRMNHRYVIMVMLHWRKSWGWQVMHAWMITVNIVAKCCPRHLLHNYNDPGYKTRAWWRHQMGTFSTLLALCAENSPVTGEFPTQRPVTRSFDVFFDLHLNKRLSKQSWGWWFETPWCPLWRHCNECLYLIYLIKYQVAFIIWEQFHKNFLWIYSIICVDRLHI